MTDIFSYISTNLNLKKNYIVDIIINLNSSKTKKMRRFFDNLLRSMRVRDDVFENVNMHGRDFGKHFCTRIKLYVLIIIIAISDC